MKPTTLLLAAFCATFLVGCHHSYQDNQLSGSWQITTNKITQTFIFSPDHKFTVKTESSKNLSVFGDWVLTKDQLVIIIRSNSWNPDVTIHRDVTEIAELNDAMLVLKDQDSNDEPRIRAFRRLK